MRKWFLATIVLLLANFLNAQSLSWSQDFIVNDDFSFDVITLDTNYGRQGLKTHLSDDVYLHLGQIFTTSISSSDWKCIKYNQNFSQPTVALQGTSLGNNKARLSFSNPRIYFDISAGETIPEKAILIQNTMSQNVAVAKASQHHTMTIKSNGAYLALADGASSLLVNHTITSAESQGI